VEIILTTFLARFLPYLLKHGEEAADAAIDTLGAKAWERARAIWGRLRPKVDEKEAAREAAEDVAAAPDDELARGAFQLQLRKLLAGDPELTAALGEMLEEARRSGVMADNGAVVISGGVNADRGGVAAGRDINAGAGGIHTGRG
jgi:hypothetical protein